MICGIGTDIVETDRIARLLESGQQQAFLNRIFTPAEQSAAPGKGKTAYYAGRWAAKEAIAKALHCGIGENCSWLDVEILNNSNGAPVVTLTGAAQKRADGAVCHLSISHEKHYACATAVLEQIEQNHCS